MPEVTAAQVQARRRGALLGLCAGDALGAPAGLKRAVAPMFPLLCEGPLTELRGGGVLELVPGQITEHTQLAAALSSTLRELRRFELLEVGRAYGRWFPLAPEGSDPTVRAALTLVAENPRMAPFAGKRVWIEGGQRVWDSAALQRAAPIGVFFFKHQALRLSAALLDCAITHFNPRCQLACVAFDAALACCVGSPKEKAEPKEVLAQIEADVSIAAAKLGRDYPEFVLQTQLGATAVREDVKWAQAEDPELYGPELHLFHDERSVRTALRLSLWELFHAPSLEAGVIDAVNRGGDGRGHGALTGALLGARDGEAAVPERWSERLLEALRVRGGPLWSRYHPHAMLELCEHEPDPNPPPPEV